MKGTQGKLDCPSVSPWTGKTSSQVHREETPTPSTQRVMGLGEGSKYGYCNWHRASPRSLRKSDFVSQGLIQGLSPNIQVGSPDCKNPRATVRAQSSAYMVRGDNWPQHSLRST